MPTNFCPSCGQPIGLPNARFCPNCGETLTPGAEGSAVPPASIYEQPSTPPSVYPPSGTPPQVANPYGYALPPPLTSPPPMYGAPMQPPPYGNMPPPMYWVMPAPPATTPAISLGRATGVTIGVIGAMLGVSFLSMFFVVSLPVSPSFAPLVTVGAFWYGLLRFGQERTARILLITWGISFLLLVFSMVVEGLIGRLLFGSYNYFFYYDDLFRLFVDAILIIVLGLIPNSIGVGIASGFARWRDIRAIPSANNPLNALLLAFGSVFAIGVTISVIDAVLSKAAYDSQNYSYFDNGRFLVITVAPAITALAISFIARSHALQQLRRTHANLFLPPFTRQ